MKNPLIPSIVLTVTALLAPAAVASAAAAEATARFTDSSKPGRLVVQVGMGTGDVTIVGEETDEVRISGDSNMNVDANPEPRGNGLRRLDGDGGFSVSETDNVITVTFAGAMMHGGRKRAGDSADVSITVPRTTSITVARGGAGDVLVQGISGDLELRGMSGDVQLKDVSGGAVIELVNGDVEAGFTALSADRPVSINVVHGDVDLRVPVDARATVSLRTLGGEMLTDFSETELKTTFKPGHRGAQTGVAPADVDEVEADRDRALADRARAEADRQRALADARAEAGATRSDGSHPLPMPVPPVPPMPPMPPAGGKLVSGTLNGGGTTISVTTIHGDITLRKVE